MVGAQVAGDRRGVVRFVVLGVLEPDREGLDRLGALLLHQRHDERRVDPAGQEGPERHVGDHALAHRRGEPFLELFFGVGVARRHAIERVRYRIPVPPHRHLAVLEEQEVRRRQLSDARVDRGR
jgi:hypothetical protein